MSALVPALEAILLVVAQPLSVKQLSRAVKADEKEVLDALTTLTSRYPEGESGMMLMNNGSEYQLITRPEYQEVVEQFLKSEVTGELTRPQLETLTVISYCGPLTKPEIEQLRGVNCTIIIRNLLVRGLIQEATDELSLLPKYTVTIDYLRHIGLSSVTELPEYAELHRHEYLNPVLNPEAVVVDRQ